MERIIVRSGFKDTLIKDFLDFPKCLYPKGSCPQDMKVEKQVLGGKHALSKDMVVMPFVVYIINDNRRTVAARSLVTLYENDRNAYVGFFESLDHVEACEKLFSEIQSYAKRHGKDVLAGPVDASFWIRYRFKIRSDRNFYDTYSGEPYNKKYYADLWKACGFAVTCRYESNWYRQVREEDRSPKLQKRLEQMHESGYRIRTSSFRQFENDLTEIYRLLTKTYRHFPFYKDISLSQFRKLFGYLKYSLNYDMVRLVYQGEVAVGFIVCVPNYGTNSMGRLTLDKITKILLSKNRPKEYVVLYMGVDSKHPGLGSALAQEIRNSLYRSGCTSIGALIHKGKITGCYYKELIMGKSEYVMLEKVIWEK